MTLSKRFDAACRELGKKINFLNTYIPAYQEEKTCSYHGIDFTTNEKNTLIGVSMPITLNDKERLVNYFFHYKDELNKFPDCNINVIGYDNTYRWKEAPGLRLEDRHNLRFSSTKKFWREEISKYEWAAEAHKVIFGNNGFSNMLNSAVNVRRDIEREVVAKKIPKRLHEHLSDGTLQSLDFDSRDFYLQLSGRDLHIERELEDNAKFYTRMKIGSNSIQRLELSVAPIHVIEFLTENQK